MLHQSWICFAENTYRQLWVACFAVFFIGSSSFYCEILCACSSPGAIPPNPSKSDSQNRATIKYAVDLRKIQNDRLLITVSSPKLQKRVVRFAFPEIVPGIYGKENYGRFVSDFQALDSGGKKLPWKEVTENIYEISEASRLDRLTYQVDDCFEKIQTPEEPSSENPLEKSKKQSVVYRSAGSSFEKGERFVINNQCLFGYFPGMENTPIEIDLIHPKQLLFSSSLKSQTIPTRQNTVTKYKIKAGSYYELVDNPIVVGKGTKDSFQVGGTKISVSVFSRQKLASAAHFCRVLKPLMEAQARYMGGKLPVNHYNFLLIWDDGPKNHFIGDGLEHSHSTLILLKGSDIVQGTEFVRSICAHEFFHILIPLTLKSKEIAHYSFNSPKQSRHLWLYEGMTEYATVHMPAVEGLGTQDKLLRGLRSKIRMSKNYAKDRSLTHLSRFAIENQDQYYNFYLKGTLCCFCLDLELLKRTNGRWNCRRLIAELSEKFGKDKPFEDDQLFDEIAELTYPDIRTWFKKYVEGTDSLPLKESLLSVGIDSHPKTGRLRWNKNPTESQTRLRSLWLKKTDPLDRQTKE